MRLLLTLLAIPALCLATTTSASAHCQVPCGIYNDHGRIHMLKEDATTIGKAVANIEALGTATDPKSFNQRVRWVQTKEDHGSHIIEVVSEYFLTQKIKPAKPENRKAWMTYMNQLVTCHAVMRAAMNSKQTVSPAVVADLYASIAKLGEFYPDKHSHGSKHKKRKRGGQGHRH